MSSGHIWRMVADMSERTQRVAEAAVEASIRIGSIIAATRLSRSEWLSVATGADVYCKLENEQHTGSFKLRGAANCLLGLTKEQRNRGCVTASSGNHGAALAFAMRSMGIDGVIFVPEHTSQAKVDAIRKYGGEVHFYGSDGLETEQHAREYAMKEGRYYVSPYNDSLVIAGQGTCGLEILSQLSHVDAAFIAVGGGGLLSGVGSVLRSANPEISIVACQPEASPVMARSVAAGRIVDLPSEPTLSDGTAGGVEKQSITFELCRELATEFILVSEGEIASAMRNYWNAEGVRIEGAAGVALAALLKSRKLIVGKTVVVIICGGNVDQSTMNAVMRSE